jgi:2,3-diaminopropionate biosynthesis protein SbnA
MSADFDVSLKLEGFNPAGSIKLKTAISLINNLEQSGQLNRGARLIESSSGNLGVALAMICANRGYHFCCVVDTNAAEDSISTMKALGVMVIVVTEEDENGGYLNSRIQYIKRKVAQDNTLIWLNQYGNQLNPQAHEVTTAAEILAKSPNVDYVFIGAGTTGTLMGCARHFRARNHHAKIIAVDVVGSVTFGNAPGPRKIPGLVTSRRPEICDASLVDDIIHVTEADSIAKCRWYARKSGLLLGGSTGSVLSGIDQYRRHIEPGSTVVSISPDRGEKYLHTIYCDDWVGTHFPDVLNTKSQREKAGLG